MTIYHPHFLGRMHHMGRREHIIISFLLRDFGFSMVEMFIPIIIITNGHPLYMVGYFYLLNAVGRLMTELMLPRIYGAYGIQNAMRASFILAVIYIGLLGFAMSSSILFIIAGLLSGVMNTLFWVSRHIDTISVISAKNSTSEIGTIQIASSIVAIIAPFIGGIVAEYISSEVLFAFTLGIFVSAALVVHKEAAEEMHQHRRRPQLLNVPTHKISGQLLANFAMNYQTQAAMLVWPIAIYYALDNIGTVGSIFAFNTIAYLALIYVSSRALHLHQFFLVGVFGRFISFILRIFAKNPFTIVFADFMGASGSGLYLSIYTDQYYRMCAKSKDTAAHVIAMEIAGDLGKLVLWSLFTVCALYAEAQVFTYVFFVGLFIVPMMLFIYPQAARSTRS